jgi:DNA polymerase
MDAVSDKIPTGEPIMADRSQFAEHDLARQAQQHLDSLKAAGVDWLPAPTSAATPPVTLVSRAGEDQPASGGGSFPVLFQEMAAPASSPVAKTKIEEIAGSTLTLDERRRELKVLTDTVAGCTRCKELAATRTQTVFGVGGPGVEICFIGEAPGADEDAQGEPFVGAAGQLLNKIIAACNMKREEVYICNIIKCRPPGNRTPLPNEAANCREYLEKQLELVRPKFICCLGSTAAQNLLGVTTPLGKLRGRFLEFKGVPVLCTYHPAYLLPHRNPDKKKDVWQDMKMLLERLGRPVK